MTHSGYGIDLYTTKTDAHNLNFTPITILYPPPTSTLCHYPYPLPTLYLVYVYPIQLITLYLLQLITHYLPQLITLNLLTTNNPLPPTANNSSSTANNPLLPTAL